MFILYRIHEHGTQETNKGVQEETMKLVIRKLSIVTLGTTTTTLLHPELNQIYITKSYNTNGRKGIFFSSRYSQ